MVSNHTLRGLGLPPCIVLKQYPGASGTCGTLVAYISVFFYFAMFHFYILHELGRRVPRFLDMWSFNS